jgi:hypothetical protein
MKTTNEGFLVNTLRRLPRHGVKALAAGAVLIAAALPLAVASTAGATGIISNVTFSTDTGDGGNAGAGGQIMGASFGTGGSGTAYVNGSGFIGDGGNVTVTSNAPGLTFAGATELSSTSTVTVGFASTSATVAGSYSVTVTDDGGTYTLPGAITVTSAPTVTTLSTTTGSTQITPPTIAETLSGVGFESGPPPTVAFVNTSNATTLQVGTVTYNSSTSLGFNLTLENGVNNAITASPGSYNVVVTNHDGGTVTFPNAFTVTGNSITNVTPSAFPNVTANTNETVTLAGAGFQVGATVGFSGFGGCTGVTITPGTTDVVPGTSITVGITQTPAANSSQCGFTVTNPTVGGNGAGSSLPNSIAFGTTSSNDPLTVTATNATTALTPGGSTTQVTFTGTGLSFDTTATPYYGTGVSNPASGNVSLQNPSSNGTSITYTVNVTSGAEAGPVSVVFANGGSTTEFAASFSIAGPVITGQTPADIPVGAAIGSSYALAGTGFNNTLISATSPVVTDVSGTLHGILAYVSATQTNLVVTASPDAADATEAVPPSVQFSETLGNGATVLSQPFSLTIALGPTVAALAYGTGTNIGVGSTAQAITITGSGFQTGVTIGGFINGNNVADTAVTAKVISVNAAGTQIKATVGITSPDTNLSDGYTVTNPDGGNAKVLPNAANAIVIGAAPTVTSVSPATASANATTAFTITGTGFAAGASVAATADGTCGTATVVSATSITVSCTFGPAVSAAALAVTNANGGSATSATVLAASAGATTGAPHATGEAGNAIIGRTVSIAVAGVGFYAQPHVTSTGNSVRAVVSKDTGTLLTVQVTVGQSTGPGEHTLTFTLANGKVFKANYLIIK